MLIRPLRADETEQVLELLQDLPKLYPRSLEWLRARLEDPKGIHVAVIEDQLVGIIILTAKGDKLKLSNIFVKEDHQHQGIGAQLMRTVIDQFLEAGLEELYLTVTEANYPGVAAISQKYGFRTQSIVLNRYRLGVKEITMNATREQVLAHATDLTSSSSD